MRLLTWAEFDLAVDHIASMFEGRVSGVYGLPRGGLCLAVALSHRMGVPLLPAPEPWGLVVDDVYETGRTLEPFRGEPWLTAVWVSKAEPTWWQAAEVVTSSEWLVFPWENPAAAQTEEESYRAAHQ